MRSAPPPDREQHIVLVVAAVQFVNILDFMMVMPLGPDFAVGLGIPLSQLGLIGGAYTAAAAVAGLIGALFLDRFDRRRALVVAMLGLAGGTALGALATGLHSLIAARVVAGLFGGPATSLALSIVADVVPPERRGRAMGRVMSAFSLSSVLGVPAGLELARLGGWWLPFVVVAGVGLALAALAGWALPPLRGHLADGVPRVSPTDLLELLRRPTALFALLLTVCAMMAMFLLVPNIASFVQANLGYPRAQLGLLYLFGGLASFAVMQVAGPLVDRHGAFAVGGLASLAVAATIYLGFYDFWPPLTVPGIFVALMTANSFRVIAYNAISSRVPWPAERARFMSLQSAAQHLAAAVGAVLSTALLQVDDHGALVGMPQLALLAIGLTAAVPPLLGLVQAGVLRRERTGEQLLAGSER